MALRPLIEAMAPVPEEFPKEYFIDAETVFGREIESDHFLSSLYRITYELSARHQGMPDWSQFWPSRADLRQIFRSAPFSRDLDSMRSFIEDRYPRAEKLIECAQMAYIRSHMNTMRDYVPSLASRYFLGQRVIKELPALDRNLHQRLIEAPFRQNLSEEDWALVVGDMAVRVRPPDADAPDAEGLPVKTFISGLQRAPLSTWDDAASAVGTGKGFFCMMPPFFGKVQKPLSEVISPEALPICYDQGPVRTEPLMSQDGEELAIANYILEAAGIGCLTQSECSTYGRVLSRCDDRTQEMIQYEAMLSIIFSYLQTVSRFAFISGYLERRSTSGVGTLRTYQKSYAGAFVATMEDIFNEDLGDSELLNGSCVFRIGVERLWSFYVAMRERMPLNLQQDWDKFRTYAEVFKENYRPGEAPVTVDRNQEFSDIPVSGERVDVKALFGDRFRS